MIIRILIACQTCGHNYTLRIGMGLDATQLHRFPCKECGEDIGIRIEVNKETFKQHIIFEHNAVPSQLEGTIVCLDANFVISNESEEDFLVQRLKQTKKMFFQLNEKDEATHLTEYRFNLDDEWRSLHKAWSLSRNGKTLLSKKKIDVATEQFYPEDPLKTIDEWLWRFCIKAGGTLYQQKAIDIFCSSTQASCQAEFKAFEAYFENELFELHQTLCFDIFKQYFENYHTFSQVHLYANSGVPVPSNSEATSVDFDKIKMFYGNAFEVFMTLVETLACLNNLIAGRAYDTFETMSLKKYKELDKAGRYNPFISNNIFASICNCVDNQLRNASHHGSFVLNNHTKEIFYKSGKGGTGPQKTIRYTDYLLLCSKIFLSITVVMRLELVLAQKFRAKY